MDTIALALSGAGTFGIIWFFLAGLLFFREKKRHHRFFLPIGLAGVFSSSIVNLILKPLIARPRPDLTMGAIIVGNGSFDYSFPSGHATMSFAAAVVLSRTEPKWRRAFYLLAVLVSFSRIYLGKHYPLDVAVGALLGWGIGWLSLYATQRETTENNDA